MGRYYRRRYSRNNSNDLKIIGLLFTGIIYFVVLPFYILILIIKLINKTLSKRNKQNNNINKIQEYEKQCNNNSTKEQSKYHIKTKTITENEKYFIDIIKKHFGKDYEIRPQVPLSSIIEKEKAFDGQYQNELNRIIDIGIFDKTTSYPLLLIEINDNTHKRKDRQVRDAKVKSICEQACIKIIAFWTEYSNTEEYIINRINTNLGDSN